MHDLHAYRRPHQSLAAVGVAALVRLMVAAGDRMSPATWIEAITTLSSCAADTRPAVRELVAAVRTPRPSGDSSSSAAPGGGGALTALPGTPAAAPALGSQPEDSPWDAKSPGDSPRAGITATRLDSTSSERRQVLADGNFGILGLQVWALSRRSLVAVCGMDCIL